jgi:hypothetical protein
LLVALLKVTGVKSREFFLLMILVNVSG